MTQSLSVRIRVDNEGIALLTLDAVADSDIFVTPQFEVELAAAIDRIASEVAIHGVLINSNKASFCLEFDLAARSRQLYADRSVIAAYEANRSLSRLYRRLETFGKPVAVAIEGAARGAGLELCLACHYRVLADEPGAELSLPEVGQGLMPSAGGTQRLPRLLGLERALPLLLEGRSVRPAEARELGLVHQLVAPSEALDAARRWLLASPIAQQPWDKEGFGAPGGARLSIPAIAGTLMGATARIAARGAQNYPAPLAVLSSCFEGLQVPIDAGLDIESKYFATLVTGPVARNIVRTLHVRRREAECLLQRPGGSARSSVQKLGVVGAGMMGVGIASVAALAGIECVLLDTTDEIARGGKERAATLLRNTGAHGSALDRIDPTADYARLNDCDMVIEAVIEDRAAKWDVIRHLEAVITDSAILASNTSTLPIGGLASVARHPGRVIGLHFFSPVDRMPLVEVITGKHTSASTLARALDFTAQLRKTPIVVKDGRGFYTTRVFAAFCYEGQRMLEEGINPALIENAARMAGMPLGPLAVSDEVSLELQYRAIEQTRADLGPRFVNPISWTVLRHFIDDLGRLGRKSGAGFYDYPADGSKRLWPGLSGEYRLAKVQPDAADVGKRLLYVQSLESARCCEHGLLGAAEADLGSVLGIGFPAYTGGTVSFIDTVGVGQFAAECHRFARAHGARFRPTRRILDCAHLGQPYGDTPIGGIDALREARSSP